MRIITRDIFKEIFSQSLSKQYNFQIKQRKHHKFIMMSLDEGSNIVHDCSQHGRGFISRPENLKKPLLGALRCPLFSIEDGRLVEVWWRGMNKSFLLPDNQPKRQHTVTKNVLLRFTDKNDQLWVFDRQTNKYFNPNPTNLTVVKNFNTFVTESGEKCYELETAMGHHIEGHLPHIIDDLEERRPIADEHKEILATYIAFQQFRTTSNRSDYINMMKEFYSSVAKITFADEETTEAIMKQVDVSGAEKVLPSEIVEFAKGLGPDNVEIPKESHIQHMIDMAPLIVPELLKLNWEVLCAPENSSFVISDNPYFIIGKSMIPGGGVGLRTPGSRKLIPLSPKVCLMMTDPGNQVYWKNIDRKFVRAINCNIAERCDRFLIAKDRPWLERLVKITKIKERARRPQMRAFTPFNRY